jgi:hypothetical protein
LPFHRETITVKKSTKKQPAKQTAKKKAGAAAKTVDKSRVLTDEELDKVAGGIVKRKRIGR